MRQAPLDKRGIKVGAFAPEAAPYENSRVATEAEGEGFQAV
jgi:hypothetical protein